MKLAIEENVSLSQYTTLKVGGEADYFVEVETVDDLKEGLMFAKQTSNPPLLIGAGSNLLFPDSGYRGIVIKNNIKGVVYNHGNEGDVLVTVGAGEVLDELISDTVSRNLWGLENLSAIPGTVGATPIQNVGAYGVEVSELVRSVSAINIDTLEEKVFSREECQFAYRDSFFKTDAGRKWVVTSVDFCLSTVQKSCLDYGDLALLKNTPDLSPQAVRDKVIEIRSGKFPDWKQVGTAGSFFKNPVISQDTFKTLQTKYPEIPFYPASENKIKIPLGWVLDNVCQLKGYCQNNVCLYEKQALVLVNQGADAATIKKFVTFVTNAVEEKTGLKIEPEVRIV